MKERYHTYEISEIGGGMLTKMPKYGVLLTYASVASLGLPGLAGFWGEFTAMWAAITPGGSLNTQYDLLYLLLVIGAALGTVLTAGYFLWLLQRVNLGTPSAKWENEPMQDVMTVEYVSWVPLALIILIMGIFPVVVFGVQNEAVNTLVGFFTV
jgi:NADH-quinone oxidoreductase subunit M